MLDERLREFWGEGYRWFDLVRTQTWHEKAKEYNISDANGREAKKNVRDIKKGYYLRPIPQGQIDGMEATDDEKRAFQNPEYQN
ncbi:MAG: RagB/SusD family nutrient uptake outer membrane protein [Bacteroidales bacterium]|nr:RagB/SusD family nutrient uptake outer membrane protein [Bacteroidales bacterium]